VKHREGYAAFVPQPIPPKPGVDMVPALWQVLSDADRALGRLDGLADMLPDPDLFVAMYVRKEAVLSSQIEGTQSSLGDLLEFETRATRREVPSDVGEVVNYVRAMNHGLARLSKIPLSLRLIREIHRYLLRGVRGQERSPGEFRQSQNWIGPPGCTIEEATFVPPPPNEVLKAMADLEMFLHSELPVPLLIKCGLVHAQFETIHPFLDGNGRIGRLLITFMLCHARVLARPLLYLSLHFREHQDEYYARLQRVRDEGNWEQWLQFFLRGVYEVSQQATETARRIVNLREKHQALLRQKGRRRMNALVLLDLLYERPVQTVAAIAERLNVTPMTANNLVRDFQERGLLREITGRKRDRVFCYQPYVDILSTSLAV